MKKRIAVLTSGGDCSGMNATIRAVVRAAISKGIEVFGVYRGFQGLMHFEVEKLGRKNVSGIINNGGTVLKTARSKEFMTKIGRAKAYRTLKENLIDGLIVIGGNGSLMGAKTFYEEYKFPVIGIPATIDNDVNGTDFTLGSDTAVNVALDAIDKIRDTATSLERVFVVEVMGRECGYIALNVALAGGCEDVLIPEASYDIHKIAEEITEGNVRGKISWIIIVAEGKAKAAIIARHITEITSLETRVTVLGHIQRGGRPTAQDRILGTKFGVFAVELLARGIKNKVVGIRNGKLVAISLKNAIKKSKFESKDYLKLMKVLT